MKMKILGWLMATGALTQLTSGAMARTARQWEPVEWQFENRTCDSNPFDLVAKAEFRHEDGQRRITTELYYAGGTTWVLRFTGAAPGQWSFTTHSRDPELDGHRGEVTIEANPGAAGFLTAYGNKWGRLGREEAFVPQIVSYAAPLDYYQKPGKIDADLKTWFEQHGFNGLHTFVGMAWFDIDKGRSGYKEISSDDPNPDPRTFQALELLITKTHRAGGMVHLWAWGDEQRNMTAVRWGLNGKVDQRLQRYICARLGPLPGWSMGYGFDLQEWVNRGQLATWHRFMHDHLGWSHFLGARAPDLEQIYDGLDYSSYQQWRPTYDTYVEALEKRSPSKPVFLEDRFRVRINVYPGKDYDLDMTRRGLWHSTMAGGAANIWAHLINAPKDGSSAAYPNREQILTYSRFWRGRFFKEMVRNNARTDGVCLEVPGAFYVFYREDTDSIQMDLAGMKAPFRAFAVDTRAAYREIPLADLAPSPGQLFRASHRSDWAIAVELAPVEQKLSDTFGVHPLFPKQFFYRGQPFFFAGKSAFPLMDADWRGFIDEAHRDGFTVLRIWLCCPALTRKHGKDHFQRNQAAGDVWPFGGTPAMPDFTRFNLDYFRRLDAILDHMESKGMVAELTLFTGGDFWPGGPLAWDEVKQRYVQFVLDRYRDRPNLYYEIANEYYSPAQQALVEKVGDFIWARDKTHLVTASAGDLPRFADKPWYRLHNFHPSRGRNWWTRVYDEVLLPARQAGLPLVNDEPMGSRAADDKEEGYPGRDADAAHHRMNFWVTVLGGGHVTFHSHKGINALAGHSAGQEFMKPLRAFFAQVPFWELEPAPDRLKSGTAYLAASADHLAAYLPAGGNATLDLRQLAGPLIARWFNPREEKYGDEWKVQGAGKREFRAPDTGDWVLLLKQTRVP